MAIQILLADDHPVVRRGLRALIAVQPDMALVGEATTGEEAQAHCVALRPDILLLDLSMPGAPAVDTMRFIGEKAPEAKVIMLTAYQDEAAARELLRLGIKGYILKDDNAERLIEAIRNVAAGETHMTPRMLAALVRGAAAREQLPHFTGREKELLALLRKGWGNKQIAGELHLEVQTVRNYLRPLYAKLGIHSRPEAVAWAHEHESDDGSGGY